VPGLAARKLDPLLLPGRHEPVLAYVIDASDAGLAGE